MVEHRRIYDTKESEWDGPARKRMRITPPDDDDISNEHDLRPFAAPHEHGEKDHDKSIAIASTAKLAPQAVAPFYAKHIPSQYAPLGDPKGKRKAVDDVKDPNTKYCYRHRPDVLCRKQADEPTMDKLQKELEQLPQDDRQGIVQVWSLFSAAPSKHRNLMLQGILAQCCFPQLSFLSSNVRELIRIDFVAALPPELAYRCLSFLDTASLCKAAQVSQKWRQMADDDVVWHHMCEQHIDRKCTKCGWGLPLLERKRLRETKRLIQLRAAGGGALDSSTALQISEANSALPVDVGKLIDARLSPVAPQRPPLRTVNSEIVRQTRPWKDVYKDRFKVGTNWKYGRCKNQVLKGHTNGVMALSMYDNILATGSYDDTIKIWDLDTGEELRTLHGHTMGIRCLQIDGKKLISGSLDKTIKVWDWRKGVCLATHTGHTEGVIGIHFDSNILISGSIDKTARVWDFKDKSISVLRGHSNWVNSVRIDTASRTVFTASDDCTVKLWDLDTKRCILTFEGHVGQVQQVVLLPPEFDAEDDDNDHVSTPGSPDSHHTAVSSFNGSEASAISHHHDLPHANTCQPFVDPFADFEPSRPRPPRYILSSGLDSTIRLWEVATGRCIRVFFGHVEGIWALAADTLRIVSGSEDSMVKVWDPRSDKCDKTYTGHRGPVTCVGLSDSRMVSGGEDGEVRVYSFSD